MPKLAIYVPKQEMRKIEKWRKRLNFSRIFMHALEREIHEQSRALEAPDDKLATAARHYKREFAESSEVLFDFGYRLGCRHVLDCRLTPEAIRRLIRLHERDAELGPDENATVEELLGDGLQEVQEFTNGQNYDKDSLPVRRTAVYRGYLKGVADAWKQVCEKMESV